MSMQIEVANSQVLAEVPLLQGLSSRELDCVADM